jgi:hypothetical protein
MLKLVLLCILGLVWFDKCDSEGAEDAEDPDRCLALPLEDCAIDSFGVCEVSGGHCIESTDFCGFHSVNYCEDDSTCELKNGECVLRIPCDYQTQRSGCLSNYYAGLCDWNGYSCTLNCGRFSIISCSHKLLKDRCEVQNGLCVELGSSASFAFPSSVLAVLLCCLYLVL